MAEYGNLPFKEQIEFFSGKVNLPTGSWTDIWEGMHARAFVVAGAMEEDILCDFRTAVDKAIAQGVTLQQFRKDFDEIVTRHGWEYNGGRNWRTRVIYDTNLRQSYSSGRELQMRDPELRKRRPYGLYRHGGSATPRPDHLAWDGLVLPLDDPWWETHTPSNGWGCKCKKLMVSQADVDRMGLKVAANAPAIETERVIIDKGGPNERTVDVPKGISPGFAYNPGTAAWGKQLSEEVMESWRKMGAAAWESLTPGGPVDYGRPATIPAYPMPAELGRKAENKEQLQRMIETQIGGPVKTFKTPAGTAVYVNAASLARHIEIGRSRYAVLLEDLLTNPYEQWQAFERHRGTGRVVLRTRLIKLYVDGEAKLMAMAQAERGNMEVWTMVPLDTVKRLSNQRRGKLLYGASH